MQHTIPDDLVDVTHAAKQAHCHVGTIHRWIRKGRLRGWKRCGRWFCSQAELLGLFTPQKDARPARLIPTARTLAARASWADAMLRQMGVKK
jgi:hypothetical protein